MPAVAEPRGCNAMALAQIPRASASRQMRTTCWGSTPRWPSWAITVLPRAARRGANGGGGTLTDRLARDRDLRVAAGQVFGDFPGGVGRRVVDDHDVEIARQFGKTSRILATSDSNVAWELWTGSSTLSERFKCDTSN